MKPPDYPYTLGIPRSEMVELVPADCRRLLDVGCGTGEFARAVKDRHPRCQVWGIDTAEAVVERATENVDTFLLGAFPEDVPTALDFDCVVFNDSLEHFVDPWAALRACHRLLAPDGRVIASIPNVQHHSIVWSLIRGYWTYRDSGILDRTHLRFFTRKSLDGLFGPSGFDMEYVSPINHFYAGRWGRILRLTRRRSSLTAMQHAVIARPREV